MEVANPLSATLPAPLPTVQARSPKTDKSQPHKCHLMISYPISRDRNSESNLRNGSTQTLETLLNMK